MLTQSGWLQKEQVIVHKMNGEDQPIGTDNYIPLINTHFYQVNFDDTIF